MRCDRAQNLGAAGECCTQCTDDPACGESFLRVDWVAVAKELRARRVN
eukprot:COSAG01_NODE_32678_length_577_cov_1.336820_1_plen_47_part_01